MSSRGFTGDASVGVGYKIYYHDGTLESFDAEGNVLLPLANMQIVTVARGIPLVDWPTQWALAPELNVQVVSVYMDATYIKDLGAAVTQARRIHELVTRKVWYYLDISEGATLAAFKFARALADIPIALRAIAKQGKEIDRNIWHAVYGAAYEDWGIA